MSSIRSDNNYYVNPKPPQEYERKFDGTNYVDWASVAEVNAATDPQFRKNKYFWIDGVYYQCDNDGVTYRPVGGPANMGTVKYVKIAIGADANTINVPELASATTLVMVVMDKIIYQDFVNDGNQISFSGTTLDMTNAGGVHAGGWLIVFYA